MRPYIHVEGATALMEDSEDENIETLLGFLDQCEQAALARVAGAERELQQAEIAAATMRSHLEARRAFRAQMRQTMLLDAPPTTPSARPHNP